MCRSSSVSIVSGYELDRAIEVRSPTEARDFSYNLCVQTGSGGGVLSQAIKRGRGVMMTTHPHLVPRL
jgi:hypothetical protein